MFRLNFEVDNLNVGDRSANKWDGKKKESENAICADTLVSCVPCAMIFIERSQG